MRSVKLLGAAGALMTAALIGGTLIGGALAAPSDSSTAADDAAAIPRLGDGEYCEAFVAAFAMELGTDETALEDAWRSAMDAAIDASVEAGDLDADRAAAIQDRIAGADLELCRILAGHPGLVWKEIGQRARHAFLQDLVGVAADSLGMEPVDLVAALRDDVTLEEVAVDQGVSYEAVKEQILAEARTDLDTAVAEGLISQERADGIYERVSTWLDEGGDPPSGAGGRGGFGPRSHWRGGPGFGGPSLDDDGTDDPAT